MKAMKAMKAIMKAMKAMKVMKTMTVMKKMKVVKKPMKAMRAMKKSIIAKGVRAKASVFLGLKHHTTSGITKADLHKNKRGKIVTRAQSAAGKKAYKKISGWTKACREAKKALGLTGFIAIGGKSLQGKAVYAKAKAIYTQ